MTSHHITMIGAGKMAGILGKYFADAGHKIYIGAREPDKAATLAKKLGKNAQAGAISEVVQLGEIIFFAVPYLEIENSLKLTGALNGKIVVDISNPLKADFSGLLVSGDTSAAELLSEKLPNATIVKAFNSLFATVLERGAVFDGHKAQVFYASDDMPAKLIIAELIESTGFDAIDAGPLLSSRFLEALSALVIHTDNHLQHPVQITPVMLARPQLN